VNPLEELVVLIRSTSLRVASSIEMKTCLPTMTRFLAWVGYHAAAGRSATAGETADLLSFEPTIPT
jgi:hypothetical protein